MTIAMILVIAVAVGSTIAVMLLTIVKVIVKMSVLVLTVAVQGVKPMFVLNTEKVAVIMNVEEDVLKISITILVLAVH